MVEGIHRADLETDFKTAVDLSCRGRRGRQCRVRKWLAVEATVGCGRCVRGQSMVADTARFRRRGADAPNGLSRFPSRLRLWPELPRDDQIGIVIIVTEFGRGQTCPPDIFASFPVLSMMAINSGS